MRFQNAQWITCLKTPKGAATAFYQKFVFEKKVKKARLFVSAVGVYEAYINGEKLGDTAMKPGLTSYKHRLQYQSFAVSKLLKGETEICIEVGNGWAVGRYSLYYENLFSDRTAVIAELVGEYEDGSAFAFSTNESWKARSCEVVFSDIYDGETADFTSPIAEYGNAVTTQVKTKLVAQIGDGVVENERFLPVKTFVTPKGETVIDFGQNLTGFVELVIAGKKGDKISFTCAEVLDKDGNFYNENYRAAQSRTTYILDGNERILKPKFTFFGFRYIRLDEFPTTFLDDLQSICAVVLHTKMRRTSSFVCGNGKINQLYHNIIWGQKGNYLDIPTDCPQRDERLGWTGDAQQFARTAAYNFDVRKFFRKWLGDLRLEQTEAGEILGVCPQLEDRRVHTTRTSAGYGDSITVIPWNLYEVYGDIRFLKDNFSAMKRWVEYLRGAGENEYLWLGGYHYGDWLSMEEGMQDSDVGATANDLVATAFYAYSVELLIKSGRALGEDMQEYERLHARIKEEFQAYFLPDGELLDEYPLTEVVPPKKSPADVVRRGKTQTAVTFILKFGLCKEEDRAKFAKLLDEMIESNGGKMTTGIMGSPYLLPALTEAGMVKRAYDLFFNEENPSWLYSVNHGATTMWEHWNGIKEDGSFWSKHMNSFNHYVHGTVCAWMYETIAGIQIAEDGAGFKKIVLAPVPDKRLGFADCALDTVQGKIESKWEYEEDGLRFAFTVPEGAEAKICLPDGFTQTVKGGRYEYRIKNENNP